MTNIHLMAIHILLSACPTALFLRPVNHKSVKCFLRYHIKAHHWQRISCSPGKGGEIGSPISHRKWVCLKICMVVWSPHKCPPLAISEQQKPIWDRLGPAARQRKATLIYHSVHLKYSYLSSSFNMSFTWPQTGFEYMHVHFLCLCTHGGSEMHNSPWSSVSSWLEY